MRNSRKKSAWPLNLSGRRALTRGRRTGLSGTDGGCAERCQGCWWHSGVCRSTCGRRDVAHPPSSRPGSRTSSTDPSTFARSGLPSLWSPRRAHTSRWTSPENSVYAALHTTSSLVQSRGKVCLLICRLSCINRHLITSTNAEVMRSLRALCLSFCYSASLYVHSLINIRLM